LITKFYAAVEIKGNEGAEHVEVRKRGETMQELVWKPEVNRAMGRS